MISESELSSEVRKAIQLEALSAVSRWIIGVILALIGLAFLGWWALLAPWLATQLGAVPPNTIIAIDDEGECPAPWRPVDAIAGRVLVAAGKDKSGISWVPKDLGGQTHTTLTPDKIPPHHHDIRALLTGDALGGTVTGSGYQEGGQFAGRVWIAPAGEPYSGTERNRTLTRKTEPQHNTPPNPVETMPPYYVVKFCRR